MRNIILIVGAILFGTVALAQEQEKVKLLKVFAKAYGYVKYFHPSDEASEIDWNYFVAYGANEILKCNSQREVIATLNSLFQPIAPSVIFSNTKREYDFDSITPGTSNEYQSTYWQHKGVSIGMNYQDGIYNSVRINRITEIDESSSFGSLSVSLDAKKYKGKEIKYTGWVKLKEDSEGTGHLWVRVDKSDKTTGFFNNMAENPIKSNKWNQYEIVGTVDDLASELFIGSLIIGEGTLFLDDVHLYYKEAMEWVEIPIKNSDFEAATIGDKNVQSEWIGRSKGYSYTTSNTENKEGESCASIAYKGQVKKAMGVPIFEASPKFGELIEKEIGESIYCQIPLNLYATDDNTYPKSEGLLQLQSSLNSVDKMANSTNMYLGNVINTYNVFQHFYPYFTEVVVDWDKELEAALQRSLEDQTKEDHLITLQKFTAPLKDGHIYVSGVVTDDYVPPINWEWVEGELVITKVLEEDLGIAVGDVVTKVNNQLSEDFYKEVTSRISAGTKGWLDYRARYESLSGEKNEQLILEINNENIVLNKDNTFDSSYHDISIQENKYKVLDKNIHYLNLNTIAMDSITALLPELQKAKGIIFDLRGYPNSNSDLISHLLKENDTSHAWMRIPKIIYPDQEDISGFENHGWGLKAKQPYLGDKNIVFIIDGRSISYAESYMSFIKDYQLATIVGQPTAGTNGNINPFTLLGNITINWTGMKVVKHDGSQHHAIGVLPDIYVKKTIDGIKLGKDEFLEKAIEVLLK